jgi:hypothetical protein
MNDKERALALRDEIINGNTNPGNEGNQTTSNDRTNMVWDPKTQTYRPRNEIDDALTMTL